MATDKAVWLRNLRTSLSSMADIDYQRKAWFGHLPGVVADPVETIEQVVSDSILDKFVLEKHFDLDDRQRNSGNHLLKLIDKFCKETPQFLKAADVIDDLRWIEITTAAGLFLESLQSLSVEQ